VQTDESKMRFRPDFQKTGQKRTDKEKVKRFVFAFLGYFPQSRPKTE